MANHLPTGIVPASAVGLLVVATLLLPPRSATGQYRVGTDGHYNEATTQPATRPVDSHPLTIDAATRILLDTDEFAGPAVGYGGWVSDQYAAYRVMLAQPDAVDRFVRLTRSAHLAGRLYGLLGLRTTDPKRYALAVRDYEKSDAEVMTYIGCIRGPMTARAVIAACGLPTTGPTLWP